MRIKVFLLFFMIFWGRMIGYTQQIPQSPNKINHDGSREGKWTILLDKEMKEIKNKDSVQFYRIIEYWNGIPVGRERNYYRSGKIVIIT